MKRFLSLTLIIAFSFLIGCGNQDESKKKKDSLSNKDLKHGVIEVSNTTKEQKEEYRRRVESKLKELDKQIDQLKARVEKSETKARAEFNHQIGELQKKKEVVRKGLEELKSASAEAWEMIKSRIDAALEDLEKSYDRIRSSFNK